jgi:hypothetical protein
MEPPINKYKIRWDKLKVGACYSSRGGYLYIPYTNHHTSKGLVTNLNTQKGFHGNEKHRDEHLKSPPFSSI